MSAEAWIDIVGWLGAFLIIAAYTTTSFSRCKISLRNYQYINILGSLGMIANSTFYGAYPSTFANAIWLLIAVSSLFKLGVERNNTI